MINLDETTDKNENNLPFELIETDLKDTGEIDLDWIPFSNWLRFRFDNDGLIIITNIELGHSIFVNETTGLILKLCSSRYSIIQIIQGIIGKYPDENEVIIFQDVLDVILDNYKIGNLVLLKSKPLAV